MALPWRICSGVSLSESGRRACLEGRAKMLRDASKLSAPFGSFSPHPCVFPRWKTAARFVYVRIGQVVFGPPGQHCSWPTSHGPPLGLPGYAQLAFLGPPVTAVAGWAARCRKQLMTAIPLTAAFVIRTSPAISTDRVPPTPACRDGTTVCTKWPGRARRWARADAGPHAALGQNSMH